MLRRDSNRLLTTILWGNVAINVLLTLLSNSVMVGAVAFVFSTVLITFAGEILPQAYFSRHALRMASLLSPVMRFSSECCIPSRGPVPGCSDGSEIDFVEGRGALNFLDIDDVPIEEESESVDPKKVITGADLLGRLLRGI